MTAEKISSVFIRQSRPCEDGPCYHYYKHYCKLCQPVFKIREDNHRLFGSWEHDCDKKQWLQAAKDTPCIHHFTENELIKLGECQE